MIKQLFEGCCQETAVGGELAVLKGDIAGQTCEKAILTDLVVLGDIGDPVQRILRDCSRPMLLVPERQSLLSRLLLVYNAGPKSREALFASTYLAELWDIDLIVAVDESLAKSNHEAADYLRDYLALHEVKATIVPVHSPVVEMAIPVAVAYECDFITTGTGEGLFGRRRLEDVVRQVLRDWKRPLLICP